ncbi:2794_t:CDS:1 [Acaulospora colombiana]|uniref:2794_t:CDS:1 n=1 Tax=Acaulospora colombiana TaxID=27376 RepID=A0ACA9KUJ4_9GLOM|nr:2794_t:CDS:1 [Acaulospora colombiana]
MKDQLPQIIHALTAHGEKLQYLEFRFCDFSKCAPLETLSISCTELMTLKLIQCGELHSKLTPRFPAPVFPHLNSIDLQGTYLPGESLEVIFKCANIDLRSAHIEGVGIGNRSSRILDSISNHCPNITHLKAHIKKDKLSQLVTLFRSCRNLETLKIYGSLPDLYAFVHDTNDDLLDGLREIVPVTLKKFVLKTDCAFTAHCIEVFLRDCNADLTTLEYISYGSVWQHIHVLKKYVRGRGLEIKKQIAGNYRALLMRELGHVIVEFGERD